MSIFRELIVAWVCTIADAHSVIFIMTRDSLYPKVQSALAQVTARKGRPSEWQIYSAIHADYLSHHL
jgi:glucosamine 6-phosphate synthetase-like amidotransferase/phosphosugar isomerase protein